MGVRTRGLDIKAGAAKLKADRAALLEAELVIDRWNLRLATGRDMLWSTTIRGALLAGAPWLDVFCPGCGTSRAIDLRMLDRHPLASVGTLVLGLRCSWCPGSAPMPKLLYTLPQAGVAIAAKERSRARGAARSTQRIVYPDVRCCGAAGPRLGLGFL